jgi:hypothetical protein
MCRKQHIGLNNNRLIVQTQRNNTVNLATSYNLTVLNREHRKFP